MQTAPRDGTRILLACAATQAGQTFATVGRWDQDIRADVDDAAGYPVYGAWTDDTVASWAYQERTVLSPKAWRSLPALPA